MTTIINPLDEAMSYYSSVCDEHLSDTTCDVLAPELWDAFLILRKAMNNYQIGRDIADRRYHTYKRALELSSLPDTQENCWFVTVNPDTKLVTLSQFLKSIDRWSKNKCINDISYCLEQRGTTPETMGDGFHCHMLIYSNKARSTLRQRLKQCFVSCLIDVPLRPTVCIEPKIKYMKGEKSEDKMCKVAFDAPWRSLNSIPDYTDFQRLPCVEKPLLLD